MNKKYYLGIITYDDKIFKLRLYDFKNKKLFYVNDKNKNKSFLIKCEFFLFKINLNFLIPISKKCFRKILKCTNYSSMDISNFLKLNELDEWTL